MKYSPLGNFLKKVPDSKKSVSLSFSDIESIIHAMLPKSASEYSEWWANQSYGPQAQSWQSAGFIVESVDVKRRLVTFQRGSILRAKRSGLPRESNKKSVSETIHESLLLDRGFTEYGTWRLRSEKLDLDGSIGDGPCVYAHVVDGYVQYIGSTVKGFKHRMAHYRTPGSTQRTNIRVNGLIRAELAGGKKVAVLAAFPGPGDWNGLPVDTITGLEAGLVNQYRPPWNKRRGA